MKVVLHQLLKHDDGAIQLLVSFGGESPRTYFASYDGTDPKFRHHSVDEELFMRLSDLAYRRFGNCAVYQMELMGILGEFESDVGLPALPAILGTTPFCTLKPSTARIAWNKLWIQLHRIGWYHPAVWTPSGSARRK